MTNRAWVYSTMTGSAPLLAIVTGGVYQSSALKEVPKTKPYIMYRYLADKPVLKGDDEIRMKAQTFMVMVHDVPGDYARIDNAMDILKTLFDKVEYPAYGVLRSTWLEDSEDFHDDDMGTILRYSRFQAFYS